MTMKLLDVIEGRKSTRLLLTTYEFVLNAYVVVWYHVWPQITSFSVSLSSVEEYHENQLNAIDRSNCTRTMLLPRSLLWRSAMLECVTQRQVACLSVCSVRPSHDGNASELRTVGSRGLRRFSPSDSPETPTFIP